MRKILIVEDEHIAAVGTEMLIRSILSEKKSADAPLLEMVSSISQAAQQLNGDGAHTLVIVDLKLPDSSGIASFTAIRRAAPNARVVVQSAERSSHSIHAAMKAGAAGYLPKNLPPTQLLNALRVLLDGGRYFPDVQEEPQSEPLTPRETDLLPLLVKGCTNHEMAQSLGIADSSVKTLVSRVLAKLGASNRTEAVQIAIARGLVSP